MTSKPSARAILDADTKMQLSGQSLAGLIDARLARTSEADPHIIASGLLPRLDAGLRERLVYAGLLDAVAKRIAVNRVGGISMPERKVGASKWQIAQRVWVDGEHKLLAECDAAALTILAEQHRDIAARNLSRAQEYEELAALLHASGCSTLGEMWAATEESLAA